MSSSALRKEQKDPATTLYFSLQPRVKSLKASFRIPERSESVESRKINEGEREITSSTQRRLEPRHSDIKALVLSQSLPYDNVNKEQYKQPLSLICLPLQDYRHKHPILLITLSSCLSYITRLNSFCATRTCPSCITYVTPWTILYFSREMGTFKAVEEQHIPKFSTNCYAAV